MARGWVAGTLMARGHVARSRVAKKGSQGPHPWPEAGWPGVPRVARKPRGQEKRPGEEVKRVI